MLLAGCGKLDGSEVHESVSCLISLSKNQIDYDCFAINRNQHDVVNPITGMRMKQE